MAGPTKLNLKIYQGSTFRETVRWESATKVYSPITMITKSAPMVVSASNHTVPSGWRTKINGALGMKEANTTDYIIASEVTATTVTFNSLNSLGFSTYTGGGVLEYNQPIDLTGYTARMQIRQKLDSEDVIHEMTTSNGGIVINTVEKTIALIISANTTAGFNFSNAVYSLEMVSGSEVTQLISGSVSLLKEVTR